MILEYSLITLLNYFPQILTRNEHRNGITSVSYIKHIEVHVYGQVIRLGRNNVLTVSESM